jgi:hypothetical protein
MEIVSLIIAVVALVIAVLAYTRTGGIEEVRRQVKAAGSAADTLRTRTADALEKLERTVRSSRQPAPPSAPKNGEVWAGSSA